MTNQELAAAVRRIKVETGSLMCLGCGFEHSCGVRGCRLLREAADAMENSETHIMALQRAIEDLRARLPRWIPVEERLPEDCADVLALVTGLYGKCSFERAPMLCAWFGKDGWFCNEYPNWDNPGVTHWMPLPEGPKGEK